MYRHYFCLFTKSFDGKGVICDATINTLTVVSEEGDTLSFSTLDAERVVTDGILLDDTAIVYHSGKYKTGMKAQKIVVVPGRRNRVGGDRDKHGCIGSAGYQWSEVQQDCIRVFEKGIRMKAVDGSQSAFIVFSPIPPKSNCSSLREIKTRYWIDAHSHPVDMLERRGRRYKECTPHKRKVDYQSTGKTIYSQEEVQNK